MFKTMQILLKCIITDDIIFLAQQPDIPIISATTRHVQLVYGFVSLEILFWVLVLIISPK